MTVHYPDKGKFTHFFVSPKAALPVKITADDKYKYEGEPCYDNPYEGHITFGGICTRTYEEIETGEKILDADGKPKISGFGFPEYVMAYTIAKKEFEQNVPCKCACGGRTGTTLHGYGPLLYPIDPRQNDPRQYYGGWLQGPQGGAGTPVAPVAAGLMFGGYVASYIGYFLLIDMLKEQMEEEAYKRAKAAELAKIHPGKQQIHLLVNEEQKEIYRIFKTDTGVYVNGNVKSVKDDDGNPLSFNLVRVNTNGGTKSQKVERLGGEKTFDAIVFPWIVVIRKDGRQPFTGSMKCTVIDEDGNPYEALLAQAKDVVDGDESRAYVIGGTYAVSGGELEGKKLKAMTIEVLSTKCEIWGHIYPVFISNLTPNVYLVVKGKRYYDGAELPAILKESFKVPPSVPDSYSPNYSLDLDANDDNVQPITGDVPFSIDMYNAGLKPGAHESSLKADCKMTIGSVVYKCVGVSRNLFFTHAGGWEYDPSVMYFLYGYIRDQDGTKVNDVDITVSGSAFNFRTGTTYDLLEKHTAKNGIYSFGVPMKGDYNITLKKSGYKTNTLSLNVPYQSIIESQTPEEYRNLRTERRDLTLEKSTTRAGGGGKISGVVKDASYNNIEGAAVDISELRTEYSDENGMFSFDTVGPGVYIATVTCLEHAFGRRRVEVIRNQTAWLDCILEQQYYIGNQRTNELHLHNCVWVKLISSRNKKKFSTIQEALNCGYNGCYYCLTEFNVEEEYFIGNSSSKELHRPDCEWASRIGPTNKVKFLTLKAAFDAGYNGCSFCLKEYDTG